MSRVLIMCSVVLGLPGIALGQTDGIRDVTATDRRLIPLHTQLRFTTMVVLPDGEEILDVICGDRDFWVISAVQNVAHVKPAQPGAATNLNLVTASGHIYSFLLTEGTATETPDLKVYVNADAAAPPRPPVYYSASAVAHLQQEVDAARTAVAEAARQADERIAADREAYPLRLQFVYGTPRNTKPFFVRAMWHDGQFTYLHTDAPELPVLYEWQDGAPAIVNFQVRAGGTYVVPKVLDRGYLALGNARFPFARQER